ncbi:YicC/YloC family endoribonuclease [Aestuariivita boseongensis]|uniref:YicC/YloC family endoribonuclease n=1 Tax=Aestuariivita boseongensis TaxID=1470562 RepID=UPI0006834962|nr:YicC/YloC family endoribonuclease [Aestuariivita boseongensis]
MIRSMTGFASAKGALAPYSWGWELRSVNSKGLDLRLRVPDWISGLEAGLRAQLGRAVQRGSVTLSLRVMREDTGGVMQLNRAALEAVLTALAEVEAEALERGMTLAPSKAADLMSLRGVLETGSDEDDTTTLAKTLLAEAEALIADFLKMRAEEGVALDKILRGQLDQIAVLTDQAAALAEARKDDMAQALKANLARVMDNTDSADPQRVAQELALIAVKADVTEEIDRLRAHIDAAITLLDEAGAVGRKLDFLMQEFNREANTLCSKSQSTDLTAVGLSLKAVIDQMREQVQNVE